MAPEAEDCESALHAGRSLAAAAGGGARVLPARGSGGPPARAWALREARAGDARRLLAAPAGLQAGLALGVHAIYPQKPLTYKVAYKTKFQKRKEKLIEVLKPPRFILSMILLIICIHLWGSERLRGALQWAPDAWRAQPWRLLSYGLVHAHAAHLALNALVALAVGWRLEREQGWWRVAAVWAGGVLCGALGAGALQPRVRVVGASAAVYAMLTAHLPNVCLRFGHIPLWWFRPLSVLVLGASEGCWALARGAGAGAGGGAGAADHVAWAAHALGAAVGVPLAFLIFTGENQSRRYLSACRLASALALGAGAGAAALYYGCRLDER